MQTIQTSRLDRLIRFWLSTTLSSFQRISQNLHKQAIEFEESVKLYSRWAACVILHRLWSKATASLSIALTSADFTEMNQLSSFANTRTKPHYEMIVNIGTLPPSALKEVVAFSDYETNTVASKSAFLFWFSHAFCQGQRSMLDGIR